MKPRDPQTYALIGAGMEVHNTLGHGFLEAIYAEAFCEELNLQGIPFQREVEFQVRYKGKRLRKMFRADLVCFDNIIVELKALSAIDGGDKAQTINYLKASGHSRGLLLNLGARQFQYEHLVWNHIDEPDPQE
jgi:GxxExxY protein